MATTVTQSTFLSQYNDDFRDSDHYHRILFNNGRALQARELTQSQTIIQSELAKLAGFVFKEGGIFNTSYGSLNSGFNAINYIKVNSLPVGYDLLVGEDIINSAGIIATIKAVIPATGSDNNTLLIRYVSANNNVNSNTLTPSGFESNNVLTYNTGNISGTLTVQSTNTVNNPSSGKGSFIEVPQFNTFVAGHLIMVEAQSLVISKYDAQPTVTIGFKLTEQIITSSDNIALYDNSGTTPNLTSPGADRYKILLTLIDQQNVIAGETFYPVYKIIKGEVRALQSKDNLLNELGTILNSRTDNITGDFIVRHNANGHLDLEVAADSDYGYLQYKISGGTAFVKGNRIEKSTGETLRVAKARDLTNDIDTKTNEFVAARYGNYFLADSCYGLIGGISTLASVNLYAAVNRGGAVVGTARIRNIDEFDNAYRLHVFDLTFNSTYGLANVRSIGSGAADYANISPIQGRYDLNDRDENSLLFPMPRGRVQEISNVSMTVAKVYSDTTDGSGVATFNTGSSNIFVDNENWIVSADADGELFSPPTVASGIGTTAVTVSGLPTSAAVKMLGYESISAVRKTKILTNRTETLSLSGRDFILSRSDIYTFVSVVDDITSEDITYKFIFDNGQRDNFYTMGGGRLKSGTTVPSGTVTVIYKYFSHSAGDYFGGKPSFPDVEYENVPIHTTTNGREYRLTDVIDVRPIKNTTGANFTGTGAVIESIPRNTSLITIGTVKYWEPRVDVITLNPEGQLLIYSGNTARDAIGPNNIPNQTMKLHEIILNPYTIDNKDLLSTKYGTFGYQMGDIERLENRISNLEVAVTLTTSELQTIQTAVPDPLDATLPDRVKLGLTADGFSNNLQSAVIDNDYRANISRSWNVLTVANFRRDLPLYYDSDLSLNTIIKGATVWPKYTEQVMINQNVASKAININQFEISRSVGAGYLTPDIDTWTVRKKVDNKYQVQSATSFVASGTYTVASQGEQNS
jgi:hypothetical protein